MENRMKLGDFIATTLTEIIDGVKRAQEYAKEHGATINSSHLYKAEGQIHRQAQPQAAPLPTPIDFDIMLTISQDDKEQGGVGIFAAAISAGVKGEVRDYAENASHVNFQIVVQLPTQD